jgi:putative ABC transport system ATP-binding protein
VIQTRSLRHHYADGPTLSFDDVDVPQGGLLLLRGRSGTGKSTWLALAAGLLSVQSGEMRVAGQSLGALTRSGLDAWRARHLGFLPQKLHLSQALSVEGNLALVYFAAGLRTDRNAIGEALARLGVAHLAGRKPSQLSGGQAQRVALARSILMRPRVILADEPTASLDDEAAADALGLLHDCARETDATLVIATHDARVQAAFPGAQVHQFHARREAGASAGA